jgi:drug/metabolite transporter (DMT)-like permease
VNSLTNFYFILLLFYAAAMGYAQIIFTLASKEIEILSRTHNIVLSLFLSRWMWVGAVVYFFATLFWIWILNKVELRYAYPVASLAIIFAVLFQSYINKNFPPFSYWFGIIMIIIGLFIAIYENK